MFFLLSLLIGYEFRLFKVFWIYSLRSVELRDIDFPSLLIEILVGNLFATSFYSKYEGGKMFQGASGAVCMACSTRKVVNARGEFLASIFFTQMVRHTQFCTQIARTHSFARKSRANRPPIAVIFVPSSSHF
jgi:hypothetical protein